MKGVIFSEMIHWVEAEFSPRLADDMIQRSGVPNDGAYTTGGYYPHEDALAMLGALSALTERPVGELAQAYGRFLSGRLVAHHPQFMAGQTDVRAFLRNVEPHIHSEVSKLYPEVRTPRVDASDEREGLHVTYASHRPFADVAHGLIEGFVAYFGEDLQVERISTSSDGTEAEFRVGPVAG
jgi:Haem-NO-binding